MSEKLFGSPVRVKILTLITLEDGISFTELKRKTGLTDGNLSSHIAKLEREGIIKIKKKFVNKRPRTQYFLTKEGREAFLNYLSDMEKIIKTLKEGNKNG